MNVKKKVFDKILIFFVALIMLVGTLPATAFAEGSSAQVRVIVENTVWLDGDGAPWSGTLVDTWVDIDESSTMMSALIDGLKTKDAVQKGAETNSLSEINGLANGAAGADCKWKGSINDNDVNEKFGDYAVSKGNLSNGSIIRIEYSGTVAKEAKTDTATMSLESSGSSENGNGTSENEESDSDDPHANQVRVIVENTTFTPETAESLEATWDNSFWSGTLVDTWVDIDEKSTMMGCVVAALDTVQATQTGAENNYLSEINGLSEFDGGFMSGWMGTLNDWFTNEGFGAFTVANGKLEAGDEIRIMYTTAYGDDLGGSWGNSDTTVKDVAFSIGTLDKAFDKEDHEYILTVPKGTKGVVVTPTASNKNYQVRTRIGDDVYKRTATVPISHGTEIIVECNYEGSASMNSGDSSCYTITVQEENKPPVIKDDVSKTASAKIELGESYKLNLSKIFSDEDDDKLSYTVAINEDKAIKAEEEYSFTPNKEGQYTLAFKANDGTNDTDGSYTVTLNVAKKGEGKQALDEAYNKTGEYMSSLGIPGVGSTGGEWMTIGLARADALPEMTADGYYLNVVNHVSSNINDSEQLHRVKSTENSRVILGLTAIGRDVTDVDGHNLLEGLTSMTYVKKQGINGPIWALIAFDSKAYDIPMTNENADDQVTREKLIEYTLSKQLADGGWALSGKTADPDMTAMAMQSLAPYYSSNAEVKAAVDNAVTTLSKIQREDGGYASWGTVNPESIAQVIVALTSIGIDPVKDERFIKNGYTLMDSMLQFYVDGGGFKHTLTTPLNGMSTEQAYYAMAAYDRFINGKTSLYDMTDVPTVGEKQAAKKVVDSIEALGTVSLSSEKAIANARTAYNALSESAKALVTNYDKLTAAEKKLKELKDKQEEANNSNKTEKTETAGGNTASAAAKTISAGKVPLVSETAAAKAAISKIDSVISPTEGAAKLPEEVAEYTGEQMQSIIDAYKAYNELSAAEKLAVENSDSFKEFKKVLDKIGKKNHYDEATGVDMTNNEDDALPWYAKTTIAPKKLNDEQNKTLTDILGDESEVLTLEDISFVNVLDESEWHPENIVKVKFPMADLGKYKSAVIIHITDDGKIELIEGKIIGEFIEFEASSFSLYGIAGSMQSIDDLLAVQDMNTALPWILAGVIALIAILVIIFLKKRHKRKDITDMNA